MALSKQVYHAFEEVVGANNISDDPALLDSYRYPLSHTAIHLGPHYRVYSPRGEAVLLPASTAEVQAIVKLCNKYKIRFKPSSTFWSAWGYPLEDNTIQLDMRRMDKIIEIDKKNMYAVVEPYVIGAILQAEAMKVGLNTHIHGPGSSCSSLASATALGGLGPDTLFMGHHSENTLGAEWVMPDGVSPYSGHITAMAYASPHDFSAQHMLPADDPRMQTALNFLNWGTAAGSANARALYDGRLYGYLRHRFNDPAWVRRVMPQAEEIGTDENGDVHYRIAPAFLQVALEGRREVACG